MWIDSGMNLPMNSSSYIKCPKCKTTAVKEINDGLYTIYLMTWNKKKKQYEKL